MPLFKKKSKIFKSNDAANGPVRKDSVGLSPAVPPTILEEYDERDIAAVTLVSLQDEITRLEVRIRDQASQISTQEQASSEIVQEVNRLTNLLTSRDREKESLRAIATHAETRLKEVQDAHSTDLSSLNLRLRDLSEQLQTAHQEKSQVWTEKSRLQNENALLQNDCRALFASNQQYEPWVSWAKARHTEQEQKIRDLEHRLTLALRPMDELSRHAFNDAVQWSREKKDLEASFEAKEKQLEARFEVAKTISKERIQSLSTECRNKEEEYSKERSMWETRIAALEAAFENEKREHSDATGIIEALEANQESLQEEIDTAQSQLEEAQSQLQSQREEAQLQFEEARSQLEEAQSQLSSLLLKLSALFGPNPTPRQFLFLKLFVANFPRLRGENAAASSRFSQSHQAEDLTANDLDMPLAQASLATFVNSISAGSLSQQTLQGLHFMRCPGCRRHKLDRPTNENNRTFNEYPRWFKQNKCRTCTLCTDCLKEKLEKAIAEDWWYELDSPHWLKCPVDGCQSPLEISSVEELVGILRDFTDADILRLKAMFSVATTLREALSRANPRPSQEEISISISLHQRLIAFGLFKDEFNVGTANYDNISEPFDAGEVLMGKIDHENLKIPIFTKFFRRGETAEDCPICLESYHEIEIESQERWRQACEGYQGSWMTEVFSFVARDALHCDHEMNVCKTCVRHHLASQLEQHGRNARDRLTCLICNRILSEQEFRCLGSAETVQTYDHYLLLSLLSNEPNFRSCLSGTCNSGQIYEQDEYPNPHISCEECGFEMCFTHQIPWHTGLSCDQYDSQREHGDPHHQENLDWMQNNSKDCPGCNVHIQKGNACFHMTCTQCRHEFCWECLADWSRINPRPGTYLKDAHNTGCWFRDSDLEPTQISGTDLREALRRRGR